MVLVVRLVVAFIVLVMVTAVLVWGMRGQNGCHQGHGERDLGVGHIPTLEVCC